MAREVSRGGDFLATFKAAATMSVLFEQVYISAEDTVAVCETGTRVPIGTVADKSTGGAGSSVLINLFTPSRKGIARGVIAAGNTIMNAASTTGYIVATTLAGCVVGVAVTDASVTAEIFEFIPIQLVKLQ